jgi:hypothetical protein
MYRTPKSAAVGIFAFMAFFAILPSAAAEESLPVPQGRKLELTIRSGGEWSHQMKFGLAKVTLTPQFAVWLTHEDGTYAGDLLVTKKAAKSSWGKVRRPEALPVWSHARGVRAQDGLYMPTKATPLSDAVTGATPKPKSVGSELKYVLNLPRDLAPGRYRVLMELNNSFDYNAIFAEKLPDGDPRANGVNGQPSVVYAAWLDLEDTASISSTENDPVAIFEFIGTGQPLGLDGEILPGRQGLTTALEIAESISIRNVAGRSK